MAASPPRSRYLDAGYAGLALAAVILVSVLGQIATFPNLAPWYASLTKPSFNPPNWVFGPVWTTLYLLVAFALWRVLRLPPKTAGRSTALVFFFGQLALNAVWSWMFFWAHSPLLGLIDIVPQLVMIVATIVTFARVDRIAAWCFVPLLAWVAYASLLNVAVWRLNG